MKESPWRVLELRQGLDGRNRIGAVAGGKHDIGAEALDGTDLRTKRLVELLLVVGAR
jgi:hypothetical protein